MMLSDIRVKACIGILCGVCLFPAGRLLAQAPPGPLPPSHPLPPAPSAPPAKKKVEVPARKTLGGFWKLNADESDDPRQKLEDARKTKAGPDPGSGGPMGGPRVGIGYPYPDPSGGPNGPYGGGRRNAGDTSADNQELQEVVRPATTQEIMLRDVEVDSSDEHRNRLIFYTDGRKIEKSTDDSLVEVSARWNGPQLVTDETGPKKRKMSRTLELSPDGRQMFETWHIQGRRSDSEVVIRYVYDAAVDQDL